MRTRISRRAPMNVANAECVSLQAKKTMFRGLRGHGQSERATGQSSHLRWVSTCHPPCIRGISAFIRLFLKFRVRTLSTCSLLLRVRTLNLSTEGAVKQSGISGSSVRPFTIAYSSPLAGYDLLVPLLCEIGTPESGLPILANSIFGDHTRSAPLSQHSGPNFPPDPIPPRRRVWYMRLRPRPEPRCARRGLKSQRNGG